MVNAPKISQSSSFPYQDLYIYYVEGPLDREDSLLGPDFLGNWMEDGSSFLFFTSPSKGLVQRVIDNDTKLRLIDGFHFTYEESMMIF